MDVDSRRGSSGPVSRLRLLLLVPVVVDAVVVSKLWKRWKHTLVTLVSQKQPLWRGVTQGGVAPVFPFRASP